MVLIQSRPMRMPSAPITVKTWRQPNSCAIQPISGAKITVAKYCPELKNAEAVPRSLLGNQAATMRALAGDEGGSGVPTREGQPNSTTVAGPGAEKPAPPRSVGESGQNEVV